MVNHVPNEALTALDEFGRGHLEGRTVRVTERLRSDLRLVIEPGGDDTDGRGETATCRFPTRHTQRPPRLRDRGSYVETIVDGVDARLVAWGIEPPRRYEYAGTDGDWHRYEGRLRLP